MSDYLPLFIDFKGRKVVIFGGGGVGERKAQYFVGTAAVTVISPSFTPVLEAMQGIALVRQEVTAEEIRGLIAGAFLVVTATGDAAFNEAVVRVAREAGILVNSVHGESGVILPAKITRGDISIAIATGGKSPAMSKYLRQRLDASLGEDMADMVRLQADVREVLKKVVPEQKDRERLLWDILNAPAVWEAMKTSYDDALTLALMRIKERKP